MRVEITCANRVGILHEIMAIFGEYKINVTSGELGGESGDKVFLSAPSLLTAQYQTIEKSLLRLSGVKRVRRIALIPSERRHFELDTLLRHVADPVLSVDREGRVIAANLAAARTFGVSLDRVPGLQLQRFLPQLMQLLQDFAVPRYGLPVSVRGKPYRMEWSPIALADTSVESLAGAVLTLQSWDSRATVGESPEPVSLWDFDARRGCCLQLQELAELQAPLLIAGERGSGKSTFAAAVHYLSPQAAQGNCYRLDSLIDVGGASHARDQLRGPGTLILEDLDRLLPQQQQTLVREIRKLPDKLRLVATATSLENLVPALAQHFATLAIKLPPLRAMRPALQRFSAATLRELARKNEPIKLEDAALDTMRRHDWPDNFNSLKDYLAAALARCRARAGDTIEQRDLADLAVSAKLPWRDWSRGLSYREIMQQMERALLAELAVEHLSTRELARRLGISHTAVANKLRKYGLGRSDGG